ncbi:MAG: sugar fermentation stimulation protein, partial [Lachnospiraceae bacterium]|nr:sugar fermentation stimulation protein [Lachnospiraceae bacterium]
MKKKLLAICLAGLMGLAALTGCSRSAEQETEPAETVLETSVAPTEAVTSGFKVIENAGEDKDKTISVRIVVKNNPALPGR